MMELAVWVLNDETNAGGRVFPELAEGILMPSVYRHCEQSAQRCEGQHTIDEPGKSTASVQAIL